MTRALDYAETYIGTDAVVAVDRIGMRRNLPARLRVINYLARAGFAAAIQPNYNRELIIEDALMRATRAADADRLPRHFEVHLRATAPDRGSVVHPPRPHLGTPHA